MSAPVTTPSVSQPCLARRAVEPTARRRASDYSAHGQTRGRSARKSAAVAASLTEWGM